MRFAVIVLLLAGTARLSAATPWGDRCKARLAKATSSLSALGKPTMRVAIPLPPKTGPYDFKDLDAFGELSLIITGPDRTFTATIGADHSSHRHRPMRGLESRRYEEWHSPYVDSLDGKPPAAAVQPMLEEFHHRLTGSIVRAELRIDAKGTSSAAHDKLFADTIRPVLAACWTDVLPDEADTSLGWTTACLADLSAAHAALVKLDPLFKNGACTREQFGASCGNVKGPEPTWNALTTLAGGRSPVLVWRSEGALRRGYGDGSALIWATDKMTVAQYAMLAGAFEKPLERCTQLLRTNMYGP